MAKTLLNGTNEVLRKVGFITGESGELSSLTDSARQVEIDIVTRNWNTVVSELYSLSGMPHPQEVATSTITLVTGQREYDLPTDLLQIRYPIIYETDQHEVLEYPGGYEQMRKDQLNPADYDGRPNYAVISPITGKLRFDYAPTATENGNGYTLYYDKEILLAVAADEFPFSETVFNHLVNVVAEDWKRDQRREFDTKHRDKHLAIAAKLLLKKQPLKCWGAQRG